MGAKQSKRSVDISGKEAESAGEVAAAGAGGEGRVEALADADALKPQANGAPHIHEQTDKEKQLDSGTPENEKDATTEKETKEGEGDKPEENKEEAPVTNGEATEAKPENGDSSPAPEDGKKPKKEKVKKKWSLRSISFSRKDKPKQEKKQKEEEPKTNGEPEKVPEEAAEVTPENGANEVAEEAKPEAVQDEKTPETPVTEPLTNGTSAPESPKVESPAADEPAPAEPAPAPAAAPAPAPEEAKPEAQPEQLPVNGLSLEEQKPAAPEPQSEESKPEAPAADATETVPAPEIPVKKEVCVERMPLESTPPPLPANPPPSSVASFAATTMAPELTDASLPNTDLAISPPQDAPAPPKDTDNDTVSADTQLPPPLKETDDAKPVEPQPAVEETVIEKVMETSQISPEPKQPELAQPAIQTVEPTVEIIEPVIEKVEPEVQKVEPVVEKVEPVVENAEPVIENTEPEVEKVQPEIEKVETKVEPEIRNVESAAENKEPEVQTIDTNSGDSNENKLEEPKTSSITAAGDVACPESNVDTFETVKDEVAQEAAPVQESELAKLESPDAEMPPAPLGDDLDLPEPVSDSPDTTEDLPPPPPPADEDVPAGEKTLILEDTQAVNSNHISDIETNGTEQLNGNVDTELENMKNKARAAAPAACNGGALPEPMELSSGAASPSAPTPPPPADRSDASDAPQEPIAVSDKLADLIPEVPVVPELNTQTETSRDVALAN